MNYDDAYKQAKKEWIQTVVNSPNNPQRDQWKLMLDSGVLEWWEIDELKYAVESWEECEQVKLVWDDRLYLKIKWEHSPWWVGDALHSYYCIMAPINEISFDTPYNIAKKKSDMSWEVDNK
jgi:hypothetical protein|tara:strand:+ start:246 stop:608 length:363 start_codon:yes stop_codon:yes gene_type:complete